jgi:hypothetical protein
MRRRDEEEEGVEKVWRGLEVGGLGFVFLEGVVGAGGGRRVRLVVSK